MAPVKPPPITDGIQSQAGLDLLKDSISIRVEVGHPSWKSVWNLPKELLVYHSTFFDSALNGKFLETSRVVALPEDDPAVFELFVQWLYVGKDYLSKSLAENDAKHSATAATCVKAWALGDKLGCLAFRDFIMICLINIHRNIELCSSTICFAYQSSSVGSNLRKWAVDQFVQDSLTGCYQHSSCVNFKPEELNELEDWGSDLSRVLLQAFQGSECSCNPSDQGDRYLEVLEFEVLEFEDLQ